MRFYFVKGRQHLDLKGNLILSRNVDLITAHVSSAAPKAHNAKFVEIRKLSFFQKFIASWVAIRFIWGRYGRNV